MAVTIDAEAVKAFTAADDDEKEAVKATRKATANCSCKVDFTRHQAPTVQLTLPARH